MVKGYIVAILFAITIHIGFLAPNPLDELTLNFNLNESPKGHRGRQDHPDGPRHPPHLQKRQHHEEEEGASGIKTTYYGYYGYYCVDNCNKDQGTSYNWCTTTSNVAWEYCSPSGTPERMVTTYDQICKPNDCKKHGYSYYWCHLVEGSKFSDDWDYCSPPPKIVADGGWTEWGTFSECSTTCGGACCKKRQRTCTNPEPMGGGKKCEGSVEDIDFCNLDDCATDGGWSDWSEFSKCSDSCLPTKMRERTCTEPAPANGGKQCPGSNEDSMLCCTDCTPEDCDDGPTKDPEVSTVDPMDPPEGSGETTQDPTDDPYINVTSSWV